MHLPRLLAEFVEQPNEICDAGQAEIEAAGDEIGQDATDGEVEGLLGEVDPEFEVYGITACT